MAFAGYLKQSTAVDILMGPFIDDSDGKSAETGLTIDVELSKNGQALADSESGAPTHDAAGDVDGYYNCILGTTDTGTLGILTVVAHAAGFLPVRLDYQIVTANWFDTMCSTDQLDVNITNIEGSDPTDTIRDSVLDDATRFSGAKINATISSRAPASEYDTEMARITANVATETKQDIIDTNVDQIETAVGDIQGRIPAALSSGNIKADILAISTSTDAADKLESSAETMLLGTAQTGTLSTTEMTTDLTVTVNDQFNGRIIIFKEDTTTAALRRQATDITDSVTTNGKLTFTALTTAPVNGDTFVIV